MRDGVSQKAPFLLSMDLCSEGTWWEWNTTFVAEEKKKSLNWSFFRLDVVCESSVQHWEIHHFVLNLSMLENLKSFLAAWVLDIRPALKSGT